MPNGNRNLSLEWSDVIHKQAQFLLMGRELLAGCRLFGLVERARTTGEWQRSFLLIPGIFASSLANIDVQSQLFLAASEEPGFAVYFFSLFEQDLTLDLMNTVELIIILSMDRFLQSHEESSLQNKVC